MASIRARLTAAYAVAQLATVTAFGGAVYLARMASADREMAQEAVSHGEIALRILRQAEAARDTIVVTPDSLVGRQLAVRFRSLLEAIPGYVLVLDDAGRRLFASPAVGALAQTDASALDDAARELSPSGPAIKLGLRSDQIVLVARQNADLRYARRVVAGVSTSGRAGSRRELLGTILAMAPLVLLVSVTSAYAIAGRAFRPVDRITNEVEAITDGRSLHRRLAVETSGDELARLGTTLNAMIGRLETSFGALRRFTADASHELKTPLTVLRAGIERAMQAQPGSHDQLAALEETLQETARMADLVDSLLTLARADEGRFDLIRDGFHLEPLAREVFETALILGEDAGLKVSMPVVEDAVVLGDRARLRQLFLNLVTNAIKYTPRGGTVEITLVRDVETAIYAVRDTGIGISAADLPFIFERFWRADRARSRASERGGTGLGLAISQWIAQAHGGRLTVQSRLNRGSTFTVTLPVHDGEQGGVQAA